MDMVGVSDIVELNLQFVNSKLTRQSYSKVTSSQCACGDEEGATR